MVYRVLSNSLRSLPLKIPFVYAHYLSGFIENHGIVPKEFVKIVWKTVFLRRKTELLASSLPG